MSFFALSSGRRHLLLATAAAVLLTLASTASQAQDDPPAEAGRLSYLSGTVSIQPAGSDDWGQAYPNLPIGLGDRVFTDNDGRAEIQVGQIFVRLGPNSDVTLVRSDEAVISIGVARGAVHVHSFGVLPGQYLFVTAPNGLTLVGSPREFRVDVLPDNDATIFTSFIGGLHMMGAGGFDQYMAAGQALEVAGTNPVTPQWLEANDPDSLDGWSQQRDQQIASVAASQYVSPEMPGAYELDASGDWQPGTEYGAIWFPRNVPAGWAPYHNGHWINRSPWGWVWVEDESWGYAPFHYGRWVNYSGRWGWVPGPPAAHPVWSPALVVFAGGIHVGGVGVSAWFPLGPGEPYRPWYPCSPHYIDQVNISNISESPRVHVQVTYVNVVNNVNIVYVNHSIGVSAVSHADFAAGRPVQRASVVVDVRVFDHVQVLAAPEPKPTPQSIVGTPPVHAVRVSSERPVLMNEKGQLAAAKPGAKPMAPPVKAAPAPVALPGRKTIAPPPEALRHEPAEASPAPAAKPAPAPVAAPAPAPRPAALPVAKPAAPAAKPAPPAAAKAAAPPPTSPAAPKPGAKAAPSPAAQPAASPGAKPPAKTGREKKDEKDKKDTDTAPK